MTETKKRPIGPETFFLIAGLLVGLFYCIVIPYGAGFDEERHLVRIYYMSQYHFLPNFPDPTVHEEVFDLSYQRRRVQTPAFDLFGRETLERRFSTFNQLRYGQRTQSIYSPVIFLPQALIGRLLWWKYDFPILPTIILQKIAGLLIYLAGAYAAIRAVPFGKWVFAALALLPSALYQAATLNADGFTAAASFAFIGGVIGVYARERSGIRPRSIWILAALSLWLGVAKPGAIILLPLLLILIRHPFPSMKWRLLLGAGVSLAIAANVGWWALASQGSTFSGEGAQSVSRQSSLILADPLGFLQLLVQGIILTFPDQVRGWVAAYGYWAGTVPGQVYLFAVIFLLAALLAEPRSLEVPAGTRAFFAGLALFCCLAIYGIAFAANYATGGVLALAKHGRYYIPFAPLFFLGFAGLFSVREDLQRRMQSIAVIAFLLVTVYHTLGLYTAYYTYCGYEAYTGKQCALPIYKNLEKEDAPEALIHDGARVSQTFTNQCGDLETVQVFVEAVPPNAAGSLRFSLLDDHGEVVASRDFPANGIIIADYLGLPVDAPDTAGREFEIRLEAVNLPPGEDLRVLYMLADYYPGRLTINGATLRGDLLIRYICTGP